MKSLLLLMFLANDPNVVPDSVVITEPQVTTTMIGCAALHYCDQCGVQTSCPGYGNERAINHCSRCAQSNIIDSSLVSRRISKMSLDSMMPRKIDTTWHFKRPLPQSCHPMTYEDCVPLPVVTISSGSMRWVYGQNDGALYQCYEVPGRIGFTLDSLGGGGFFGVDTTAGGGSIGYKGGGR